MTVSRTASLRPLGWSTVLLACLAPLTNAEDGAGREPTAEPPPYRGHDAEPAAEDGMRVCDLRLSLGSQHGPKRIHDDYTAGSGSQDPTGSYDYAVVRDKNGGGIFQVAFVYGRLHDWGGLLWGAGLRTVGHTIDIQGGAGIPKTQDLSYGTFGVVGHIDYGYAFTSIWHAEIGPFASVGGASMEWFDQDATGTYRSDTATGGYAQGGARAATYVALWHHLVLGAAVEYSGTFATMEADHSASGAKSKLTVRENGFGGLLDIGYRF